MSLVGESCKGRMPHALLAMSASHQESIKEGWDYIHLMGIKSKTLGVSTDAAQALEIRRQALDLPVAVARRFRAVAPLDFLRAIGRRAVIGGAARRGLGKRAFGRRAERSFLDRGLFPDILGGRF